MSQKTDTVVAPYLTIGVGRAGSATHQPTG
jgi:hypothetical protein